MSSFCGSENFPIDEQIYYLIKPTFYSLSVTIPTFTDHCVPNVQDLLLIDFKCMETSRCDVNLFVHSSQEWSLLILISLVQVMCINFLHRGVVGCALCYLLRRKIPLNTMKTISKKKTCNKEHWNFDNTHNNVLHTCVKLALMNY